LVLIFFANAELENPITNAVDLLEHYSVAESYVSLNGRGRCGENCHLARVPGSVLIGNVIGRSVERALVRAEGLSRNPQ
jgi:hypothetical protein